VKTRTAIIFCFVAISGFAWPKADRSTHQLVPDGFGSAQPMNSSGWTPGSPSFDLSDTAFKVVADTIFAGDTFIALLPDSLNGEQVLSYAGRELPLRSWLRGRSFFWKTTSEDIGETTFLFDAELNGGDSTRHQIDVLVQ